MKLFSPIITEIGDELRVQAHYQLETPFSVELPPYIAFTFPKIYKDFLANTMEPYVMAVLFLAMKTNEDIHVEGTLSPHFLYNMQEYQQNFIFFSKEKLSQINIIPDNIQTDNNVSQQTLACFSGGVDSFYSLIKNQQLPSSLASYKVSHAVFIKGFDFFLPQHEGNYEKIYPHYKKMLLEQFGIDLIPVSTNFRHVIEHFNVYPWEATHGAALGSIGLLFKGGFDRYLIASSDAYDTLIDGWGSHPIPDRLIATESFRSLHHATEASRFEKTTFLAHQPATYDHLRVCWEKPNGLQNCGQCSKCLQVMMYLEHEDKLQHYTSFPKEIDLALVKKAKISKNDPFFFGFVRSFIQKLKAKEKHELAHAIEVSLEREL